MDNTAIARIAAPDLSSDALALLETYGADDDIVFFLGRFAWQGKLVSCAPALLKIARDPVRGRYARIAAIRGVMAMGDTDQKDELWETIADHPDQLDRALLAELLDWAASTTRSVELLLRTLEHVSPFERFNTTGLERSLHAFIGRLPLMADEADDHPLGCLAKGLNKFLGREPFVERGECHVSEEFAWLMPPALHVVDRLVEARSAQALTPDAIAIMRNMPALRFWRSGEFDEYKTSLSKNVPRWRDLNDLLYWTSIAEYRARLACKGEPLVDDWQVAFVGHFWAFGSDDFERCMEWVRMKRGDDRIIALSRCIQLYIQADRPAAWLAPLRAVVEDDNELKSLFEIRLNPKPSPAMEEVEAESRRWKREAEKRENKDRKDRADWVRALKADPDRVLHPAGLKPGDFSQDQYFLFCSSTGSGISITREDGANWRALIPEFGEAVARAYRDAAVKHWRAYSPMVRSEGGDAGSIPYSLIFAMTGLAIEASEDSSFAQRLTPDEAKLAFRYVNWELNGFPTWFEPLYRAHPDIGREAVMKELLWELEYSVSGQPLHYILHDILYHAPWLQTDVSPLILDWLLTHDMPNAEGLRYCLNILTGGGTAPEVLSGLAAEKVKRAALVEQKPRWFALWVDNDPGAALPALVTTLEEMSSSDASDFAQHFAVSLLGDRHGTGTRVGAYRNVKDLKTLYILMHRYIRSAEDTELAGKGVFSPTLRDNAQDARSTLFNLLVEVPGADAYAAIKALEAEHPEPGYRSWMRVRARERATMDGDEPIWTTEQVRDFEKAFGRT